MGYLNSHPNNIDAEKARTLYNLAIQKVGGKAVSTRTVRQWRASMTPGRAYTGYTRCACVEQPPPHSAQATATLVAAAALVLGRLACRVALPRSPVGGEEW